MNLAKTEFPFELLTPCLCHGAAPEGPAELRVPSIRGQIRQWHRAMVGNAATVNRIWGATEGQNVGSSTVSLCLAPHATNGDGQTLVPILPHKGGARRSAIPAGQTFTLTLRRLPGCTATDWVEAQKATKLWLIVGGLGLRCNRAAGSVWPTGDWVPKTETDLAKLLAELGCRWAVRLADAGTGTTADELRRAASDTVVNRDVFGQALGGRIPSPTRMKVIRLGGGLRLLLAAKSDATLDRARQLLATKPLGRAPWRQVLPLGKP